MGRLEDNRHPNQFSNPCVFIGLFCEFFPSKMCNMSQPKFHIFRHPFMEMRHRGYIALLMQQLWRERKPNVARPQVVATLQCYITAFTSRTPRPLH